MELFENDHYDSFVKFRIHNMAVLYPICVITRCVIEKDCTVFYLKVFYSRTLHRLHQIVRVITQLCMPANVSSFCSHQLTFFKIYLLFQQTLSGTLSECQKAWSYIRTNILPVLICYQQTKATTYTNLYTKGLNVQHLVEY